MDNFIKKFNYLGAALGISTQVEDYVDLEEFFLEATLYFESDSRIKQAILNWCARYAILLSPSKIRRLITKVEHNGESLNLIVNFLLTNKYVKHNWSILIKRKTRSRVIFQENFKKYLKNNIYIIKNVPEIRYRAEGRSQVIADILSFTQKSNTTSLYQLAKCIHSPRNRVNELFHQLRTFGFIAGKSGLQ